MSANLQIGARIPLANLHVPFELGEVSVEHDGCEFFVVDQSSLKTSISRADLSQELRGISSDNLKKILHLGQLALSRVGEDYALRFNGRLVGGGFVFAALAAAGTLVAGVATTVVGVATLPIGGGVLIAAGVTAISSAPVVAAVALATPTP